jgi:hypothetical protein
VDIGLASFGGAILQFLQLTDVGSQTLKGSLNCDQFSSSRALETLSSSVSRVSSALLGGCFDLGMYGAQVYQKKPVSVGGVLVLGVRGSYFNLPTSEEEPEKSAQLCRLKASFISWDGRSESGLELPHSMMRLTF